MIVDDILVIVILAILLLYVYRGCRCESGIDPTDDEVEGYGRKRRRRGPPCQCKGNVCRCKVCKCKGKGKNKKCKCRIEVRKRKEGMANTSNVVEGMAPLNFGTFYNNYPRGECRTGKFLERKPCEIGNCPLGTTVSDQQFCRIQCAQDPDCKERQGCYDFCMRHIC